PVADQDRRTVRPRPHHRPPRDQEDRSPHAGPGQHLPPGPGSDEADPGRRPGTVMPVRAETPADRMWTSMGIGVGPGRRPALATTGLEVSAQLVLEVQVQEEGVALVPARLLADMVKSFEQAPVEFEAQESQATIVCSNYRGTVRCLPAEDFPILQEAAGTRVQVGAHDFALAASQVARAASRDEARPILTGVLLEITPEGLTMVATDSYRLALRELT